MGRGMLSRYGDFVDLSIRINLLVTQILSSRLDLSAIARGLVDKDANTCCAFFVKSLFLIFVV